MSTPPCRVGGCSRPIKVKSRGLCNAHYLQERAGKPFTEPRQHWKGAGCIFDGCTLRVLAKGVCSGHYQQMRKGLGLSELTGLRRGSDAVGARDGQGRKKCPRCKEWRPEVEFGRSKTTSDGFMSACRPCYAERYQRDKRRRRDLYLVRNFGITLDRYEEMFEAQGGKCATCASGDEQKWHLDHDHSCCPEAGKSCGACIRGILCNRCNLAIGLIRDCPDVARGIADYLTGGVT